MASHLEPIGPAEGWDERHAGHLLRRAGFGVPSRAIPALAAMSPADAVDYLVEYERQPLQLETPSWIEEEAGAAHLRSMNAMLSDEQRQMRTMEFFRRQRQAVDRLKAWWIRAMLETRRPLEQKLTLFWHGHFAVSAEKVRVSGHIYNYYETLRRHASGSFRTLVREVGITPAMLGYLDNRHNRKGEPNENFARELMELFTLGIGNYTEQDIKEAARAFTGYTTRDGEFRFVANQHDYDEKTVLGVTGNLDAGDVVDILLDQPAASRFIGRKLWEFFAYTDPEPDLVEEVAAALREANWELKPVLRAIFLSRAFYSRRAFLQQVKSPVQYLVGLLDHAGGWPARDQLVTLALRALGQDLFYPPNVKGWDGGRAWINTNTLLLRMNMPAVAFLGEQLTVRGAGRLDDAPGAEERMAEAAETNRPARRNGRRMNDAIRRRLAFGKPAAYFEPHAGRPVGEALQAAAVRVLGQPLAHVPLEALAKAATGGGATTVPVGDPAVTPERQAQALRLLFSMAEYQLC
jgi:uncharacterized protein (DUF1800 family)